MAIITVGISVRGADNTQTVYGATKITETPPAQSRPRLYFRSFMQYRDLHLAETNYGGVYIYRLMVDGKKYDQFVTTEPLTWSQQADVEAGYREALDNYDSPVLGLSNHEKLRRL